MEAEPHTTEVDQVSVLQFTPFFAYGLIIYPRASDGTLIAKEVASSGAADQARMDRGDRRIVNGDGCQRGVPPQCQFRAREWEVCSFACGVLERRQECLCGL